MAGSIGAFYGAEAALISVALTFALCICITLFAMQTRFDFTMCSGFLFVFSCVVMLTGIAIMIVYFVLGPNKEKTTSVAAASAAVGLNKHKGKSKILRYNTAHTNPITIDGEDLEDVKTFTYLGSIIDEQGGSDRRCEGADQQSKSSIFTTEEHLELKARIDKARAAYLQLRNIWNSKQLSITPRSGFSIQMSRQFYCMGQKPGELRKPSSKKIPVFINNCLRQA
ncbi:unnamed protein product [Schistosoma mattheei]|uniref:Uncharacterized protein n=1 Tax=Schistosoma mattheei TaxID=31246 RepID=A0A183Q3P2_9TREM|nr:unnamed protein product [Schistosoma mattheei]